MQVMHPCQESSSPPRNHTHTALPNIAHTPVTLLRRRRLKPDNLALAQERQVLLYYCFTTALILRCRRLKPDKLAQVRMLTYADVCCMLTYADV